MSSTARTADTDALIAANPFPGLRAFKPGEADRFFGRQQQIDELVARLAEVPFIAVSGASGCGKSSLVLAGLLHELKRRRDEDFETDWRAVVMRPGNRPIANLAGPLADALEATATAAAAGDRPAGDATTQRADTLYGQLRLGGTADEAATNSTHNVDATFLNVGYLTRILPSVIAMSILFVLSAVGNITVFTTLAGSRLRKTRISTIILHLTISDLIVTFLVIPSEVR